jgi:pimeloyl-ACP methyl ester carboxylesterase
VGIGLELLESLLNRNDEDEEGDKWGGARAGGEMEGKNPKRNIAIFGHSMGAKAALLMALTCSKSNVPFHPSLVVLVAPALEGVSLPSSPRNKRKRRDLSENSSPTSIKTLRTTKLLSKLLQSLWITWREIFIDFPFRYFLRRLVGGSQDFWKKGLSLAWGDPNRLTDSDVLRFQWPSIGMGWEQGLLNFGRYSSSSSSSSSGPLLGDEELLSQVSSLPNTQVVILYGSKDKIVRFEGKISEKVKNMFPTVTLIRMGGLGHDPFEEDVDSFLIELKKAVVSH